MKKPKKLIILAGIVIVVIGASAAAAVILSNYNSSNNDRGEDTQEMEEHDAVIKGREASKLALEGDVQGGVDTLEDAIQSTNDSYEKYILYSEKASLLLNNGQIDEAFEAAKLAYDVRQDSNGAALVAQIAEQKGDRATAIEYYKKAADLVDPETSPLAENYRRDYREKVAELEGAQ